MQTQAQYHDPVDPFTLTPERIHRLASRLIVERGMDYALKGRVIEVRGQGGRLDARVEGTRGEPYLVSIVDDGDGGFIPSCTCPFDWEPFCKHAVAALARYSEISEDDWKKFLSTPGLERPEEDEIKVRKERGRKQPFKVRRLRNGGGPPRFSISSSTTPGRSYEVEIRSLQRRLNCCSCPDFENSMLGTCKHIEAVLHRIEKLPASKMSALIKGLEKKLMIVLSRQGVPHIVLRAPAGGIRNKKLERLAARFFDAAGTLRGDPEKVLPILMQHKGIAVSEDVTDFVERLAQERQMAARRDEVQKHLLAQGPSMPGLKGRLFPYQFEGVSFLSANVRALLADDMGLGKTVQAIAAARFLMQRGEIGKTLIICPASLKRQWADEISKFTSCSATVVSGMKDRRRPLYFADSDFIIANYELILRDFDLISEGFFDLLIIDEAQRLKNWRTKTAEAVKAVRSDYVFVLTGTPLENRLDDLYSIMQLIDRRILGPLWAFNEKFIEVDRKKGRRMTIYKNLSELRRRLSPVMLRRNRSEVLKQLPERTTNRYYVPITETQRGLMVDAEASAAQLASKARKRPLTPGELKRFFAFLQTARMACNAVRLVDRSGPDESPKLDEFEKIIEEVCNGSGRKAVVFTQWEIFQRMAVERAQALGIEYVRLHGGVPSEKRGDLIARFRDDPACRIFFSTDAGGVGLNLQCASALVNLELPWNPAVLEQRIGRIHRIGQKENVNVILVTSERSFEHRMENLLAGKQELFDGTILPDASADVVEVPSMMLAVARELFSGLDVEEDAGIEEIEEAIGKLYKDTGDGNGGMELAAKAAEPRPEATGEEETGGEEGGAHGYGADIRALLGNRLRCLLRLASGNRIAVVDCVDEAARDAAQRTGTVVIDETAFDALSSLGENSPLGGAAIEEDRRGGGDGQRPAPAGSPGDPRREALKAVTDRRLKAAENMAEAGLGAEAVEMAHSAMEAALKIKALPLGKEAADLSGLLYEILLPAGLISMEQAGLASRAEGIARAYAESAVPPPGDLVGAVIEDTRAIVKALE